MASPLLSRAALRRPSSLRALTATSSQCQWARYSSSFRPTGNQRFGARTFGLLAVAVASGAGALWAYPRLVGEPQKNNNAPLEAAEIVYEKPRKKAANKEERRDLVSPQHVQVKRSWEHPGVYAWGSNAGKVVAPDSSETVVKTPRRIPYFDDQLLRDLKLDRDFGAAVTEKGDLVQWGVGFSKDTLTPTVTLKGKDLSKVAVSRDRIIALSSNGSVYSIPVAKSDQESGEKPTTKSSWLPFWSSDASISYRSLTPTNLTWGEKVVDVKSGLDHCLLLTSKGRVFSAASSSEEFPSKGQLGVPGLTWHTRPAGPYDQPHEVKALSNIKAIAAGAFHSLALDNQGRAFSFGDNSTGQLGFETEVGASIDKPSPLPVQKLYSGTNLVPKVTSIAAGGQNSYFTVDATKTQGQGAQEVGRTVADTWACGVGIHGGLGTGKWTHVSAVPTKIKALSNLYEYDEAADRITPIRLTQLAVGSTHACAILDNLTHLTASASGSDTDTNFGADVLWWGGNEHYQLGTGRRNHVNVPVYISPLDGRRGVAESSGGGEPQRFQVTPRTTVRLGEGGKGRKASVEQRIECGRFVTAVYSGA
ncbi:regulator of chromosome condensation 1/beta-lactamase-inhibitor protein II [Corynascus novoguineensis]|uniref:Regulator of chromosome condensation 1/beta-lactamase-inhibitor protein II n=1 Tax=Corynascus novoguineensis TaxID=1126955 RepID=A0AAN7CX50_9PEZI|nr:regulator of chromosome condensation 1/beta-lactamase-inhibitor protein II [Corynascus novoguineensis]